MANDAAQTAQQMQTAQRRLQQLDRNLAQLEQNMQELTAAIATLDGIKGEGPLNTQVPVGGGVRVSATVDPAAKVLVDLGGGYATDLPIADALTKLRDRMQTVEAAFRTTSEEADKTAERLQNLQMQAVASDGSSS